MLFLHNPIDRRVGISTTLKLYPDQQSYPQQNRSYQQPSKSKVIHSTTLGYPPIAKPSQEQVVDNSVITSYIYNRIFMTTMLALKNA
jgi:hypothetical protein